MPPCHPRRKLPVSGGQVLSRVAARPTISLLSGLLLLITGCGLTDPIQDPDEWLPVRQLAPADLVASVAYSAPPDSTGPLPVTTMRFTLDAAARSELAMNGVLEAVVRTQTGPVTLDGWSEDAGAWVELRQADVTGTGQGDLWWIGGWTDPALGASLVMPDGSVRLRTSLPADSARTFLRVVTPSAGLAFWEAPAGGLTASEGRLLILTADGIIHEWSTDGAEISQNTTGNAPPTLCRVADHLYGITSSQICRIAVGGGGVWATVAQLPFGTPGGVAMTSDGEDLYVIHYPTVPAEGAFPILYRLDTGTLVSSADFYRAVTDSAPLRRNGLPGGNGSAMAWWSSERMFVAPGTQEGDSGLVAFSRAGRFLHFIPLPFEPADRVQFAFVGNRLFVGSTRPTLATVKWGEGTVTVPPEPAQPPALLLYRWPQP